MLSSPAQNVKFFVKNYGNTGKIIMKKPFVRIKAHKEDFMPRVFFGP